jgi:hypothetical protein
LSKSPAFFGWNDSWQLVANQTEIPEARVQEIAAHLAETRQSASTSDLVRQFFGIEPSNDLFDITALTLNRHFETKAKKEFLQVSPLEWGKWHLKSVLSSLPEGLPLAAPEAPLPELEVLEKPEPFHEFPLKVYLSWREILSGGLRIPRAFNKELSHSREYVFVDADDTKSYTVFFFPQHGYFLGLRDYCAANNIPQGTSMTLERKGPVYFHFWIKKSKKKLSVARLAYDAETDLFSDAGEAPTLALPNKIIYLERDTLQKLNALVSGRDVLDLKDLLVLIFRTFSASSTNHALHYLRAYHLVDILKRTTQEDVERVLLNSSEFSKSDKKKGIYHYHEAAAIAAEVPVEEAAVFGAAEASEAEAAPELPEEAELVDEVEEAEIEFEQVAPPPFLVPEPPKPAPPAAPPSPPSPAKKEKPPTKKKAKAEPEKAARARKSERRVIEERIEEEESEQEAFLAEKAAGEEEIDIAAASLVAAAEEAPGADGEAGEEEAAESAKGAGPGGMFGNHFAEKLKSALIKKRAEDAQKKPDDEAPES